MDGINKKLDKISDDIVDIKVNMAKIDGTLTAQQTSLDFHVKRTTLLEDHVKILEDKINNKSRDTWMFIFKLVPALAALFGIIKIISSIFK